MKHRALDQVIRRMSQRDHIRACPGAGALKEFVTE
jgi:hypothetical protein